VVSSSVKNCGKISASAGIYGKAQAIVDCYDSAPVAASMVRSGRNIRNEDGRGGQDTMQGDLQHDEVTKVKLALYS